MKRKTHEEYVAELAIKNPTVEVVEQYDGLHKKIKHHCLIHNTYWDIKPANALKGNGCSICHKERIGSSNRKLREQYIKEIEAINPNIILLGEYINNSTQALHKCIIHNVEWMTYPTNILRGCGCPKCGGEKIANKLGKDQQTYIDELKNKNPNVIAIDNYINAKTPILHRCIIHNIEWITSPASVLMGCGCPECLKERAGRLHKTHEQYEKELRLVNPSVIVLDTYIDATTPILHKCLIDGNEWYISPSNILTGYGCPRCNESKGERMVRQWLESHNIKFEPQKKFVDCRDKKPLPFDFYLPEYNAVIEYNGLQHYTARDYFGGNKALAYIQRHDKMKEEYCKKNNIGFLCIPYFKNVDIELNNFLFI